MSATKQQLDHYLSLESECRAELDALAKLSPSERALALRDAFPSPSRIEAREATSELLSVLQDIGYLGNGHLPPISAEANRVFRQSAGLDFPDPDPLAYKCGKCAEIFERPDAVTERACGEEWLACPYCGNTDLIDHLEVKDEEHWTDSNGESYEQG